MWLERRAHEYERGCEGGGGYNNGHCNRAELISTSLKSFTWSFPLSIPSSHTLPSYFVFLSIYPFIHPPLFLSVHFLYCSVLSLPLFHAVLFQSLSHFYKASKRAEKTPPPTLTISISPSLSLSISLSLFPYPFISLSLHPPRLSVEWGVEGEGTDMETGLE